MAHFNYEYRLVDQDVQTLRTNLFSKRMSLVKCMGVIQGVLNMVESGVEAVPWVE